MRIETSEHHSGRRYLEIWNGNQLIGWCYAPAPSPNAVKYLEPGQPGERR